MWIDKSRLGEPARLALLLLLMAVVASGCGVSPPAALDDNVIGKLDYVLADTTQWDA